MAVINVEIISDIVCVWCFIGKRTLEKAIDLYQKTYPNGKHDTFCITWIPYYLNHNQYGTSVDKEELSKIKFAKTSPEKMAAMSNRVHQIAQANGIKFSFKGKIGSTRDAHRLIHYAQLHSSPSLQDALVERLFQAFHEKEMDISDRAVLKNIAVDAGLNIDEVDEWLDSEQGKEEVDEDAKRNRQFAPTGVPTFFIQSEYRVDGAQDLQEFFEGFVQVREKEDQQM